MNRKHTLCITLTTLLIGTLSAAWVGPITDAIHDGRWQAFFMLVVGPLALPGFLVEPLVGANVTWGPGFLLAMLLAYIPIGLLLSVFYAWSQKPARIGKPRR